ncbi:MAG: histidine phosphatase family protein [Candidatus Pelagibacter sp.]|nr:histidine phosphatase family protein [Candidatus Pelagibacter sp.]|tara:strand:- start:250 stop:792 length:543 start_codon:yes stop_codon:yes gene_type:complete
MKKILILFFILFAFDSNAENTVVSLLKEEGKIVFIRHSIAPGGGDPENFNLKDCSTQRNLSEKGIKQSKQIGEFFKKNKVIISKVLSSQWCRCKDTAFHAFGKYEEFFALNSTFQIKFSGNSKKQAEVLKNFVKKWDGKGNIIFVTHYVIILKHANYAPSSGELVITDKNFNVLSTLRTD